MTDRPLLLWVGMPLFGPDTAGAATYQLERAIRGHTHFLAIRMQVVSVDLAINCLANKRKNK